MLDKLRNNPVLIAALVAAVVNLLVGLGLLAETEAQGVVTLLESVIVIVLGLLARSYVDGPVTRERKDVGRSREPRG